ncbi:hypothetical protein NEOLEDRAFT_1233178 [Neolentinus lepideus HHB14362 ss-1]|uniref:Uncharacterized protein n=1 Tax=Neolentinus lepideus HHB14362 ss-1 TaxID=1314782 RepID=A0A165UCS2_9AGAM|nr:hypothetical protein NEOLEDRAFT_1233178 [Neolentinus lepideus HHB14362 ss-1]
MSYGINRNYSRVQIESEPWGVEEGSKRGFPTSNKREVEYHPPPRPAITHPSSAANTAAASQRPQQAAQSSCHTHGDSWKEVSPGVLSDGRWTRDHPLFHSYISIVKKKYGASVQVDGLDTSGLNAFPVPSDPRIYALAAICKEPYPDDPAWWIFFKARRWKESQIIINTELHASLAASISTMAWSPDPRSGLAPTQSEGQEDASSESVERKFDEMEHAVDDADPNTEAGASSVPVSRKRRRRFKLTLPMKYKIAKNTEEPMQNTVVDDDATENLIDSDETMIDIIGDVPLASPPQKSTKATVRVGKDVQNPTRFGARMHAKNNVASGADIEEPSVAENKPAAATSNAVDLEAAQILHSFKVDTQPEMSASGSSTAVRVYGSDATAVARGPRVPKTLLTGPANDVDAKSVTNWNSNVRADTKVLGVILEVPKSENVEASKPKSNELKTDEPEPKNTKGKGKSKFSPKSKSKDKDKEKTNADVDVAQGVGEAIPAHPKTRTRKTSTIAKKEVVVALVEPESAASEPGPSGEEAKKAPSSTLGPTTRRTTRTRRKTRKAIEAAENAAQAPKRRSTTRKKAAVAAASSTESK